MSVEDEELIAMLRAVRIGGGEMIMRRLFRFIALYEFSVRGSQL